MKERHSLALGRWAIVGVIVWLLIASGQPLCAQGPSASINSPPVGFFSYRGKFDTAYNGVDQVYSSDAGLTLFLDGQGYGFTGAATEGPTGGAGAWTHLGTTQLTPNSFRDDLRIVTPQGNIDIAQLVSYFPGNDAVNITVTITNHSSASYNTARLVYGADTFINGDDSGDFGVEDFSATRSVGTQDDTPMTLFSGLSGFQSINDPGISTMNYFAGFFRTVWDEVRSGSLPDTVDADPRSRDQGIAISFDRATPLPAGESWTVRLQWIYDLPQSISLSSCDVTAPTSQSSHLGEVAIVFDGNNSNSNPIDSTFEYSRDGGQTWLPCTAAASSSLANPDPARATPFVGASFIWDPLADGVGISTTETVDLRVRVVESGGGQAGECIVTAITIGKAEPELAPIGGKAIDELDQLNFTAVANPGLSPTLAFSLEAGTSGSVPTGASINPLTGDFSWTPTELQGPGQFRFDVVVTGSSGSDRETITVSVAEINRAPVLAAVGNRSVDEQVALSFVANASDPDVPANNLTFSLASGAGGAVPAGASITPGGAFSWTPTEAQGPGSFTFDVVVTDNGQPAMSDRETITVSVATVLDPTAAVVSSNINPSVFGQGIVITAAVSPPAGDLRVPTGTVELRDGTTELASRPLVNGLTTFPLPGLSVGTHNLSVIYSGDAEFQPSTSAALSQVVNRSPSSSSVVSSSNPSESGQEITFTASVTAATPGAGIPSGSIAFLIDGNPAGTRTLLNGAASLAISNLSVGTHQIRVEYAGSGDFLPSVSTNLQQAVGKAASTTLVASSNNPSRLGDPVTLMATVSVDPPGRGVPTGTLEFLDGSTSLGVFPLSPAGTASMSISTLVLGNHPITARYSGDQTIAASLSAPANQVVNLPKFTITRLAAELPEGTPPGTGPANLTFTVTKNEATAGSESIGFNVVGSGANPADLASDFDPQLPAEFPDGTLVFGAASGSQVLSFRARADELFEADESFTVTLANASPPSLAHTSASGTILNDDRLRVSIAASQSTAHEAQGSAPGVFTVSRNGTHAQVTVTLELSPTSTAAYPTDFTLGNVTSGSGTFTATIPAGSASIEIRLTPVDDSAAEASEFAALQLRASPGYDIAGSGSASITIPANDVTATNLEDFDPAQAANGGEGTLRQALLNANSFPGTDVIAFASGVNGTLVLASGELLVASDLTIVGPASGLLTISGDRDQNGDPTPGDTRVFRIDDGDIDSVIDVTLSGLRITGGMADGDDYPANAGGGILNYGESLTLMRSTVTQNAAKFGAGIENAGVLVVSRSTISSNDAFELGGGIDNFGATLTVSESTIADNIAGFGGGGIENSGSATIEGSTLARNFAGKVAGAIDNYGGDLTITNSTVSENVSPIGGGLVHEDGGMHIVNCTVVENRAEPSLNANVGGGIYVKDTPSSTFRLDNSIVAGNTRVVGTTAIPSDLGGKLASPQSAYNLIGDAASAGGLLNRQNGNQTGINGSGVRPLTAVVSPLAANGGPTETHALVPGSPATDAGLNALAVFADSSPLEFDQRGSGYPRIASGTVDIGAYEHHLSEIYITSITFDPATGVQIEWLAEIGTNYEVLRSPDLSAWTTVSPTLTSTSQLMHWTDPNPPAPRAFYMVRSK